jgi:hypothetical protein
MFVMKQLFALFFLVTMTLNVAIPFVERLHAGAQYELSEIEADDTDEESKKGQEKEKEKDAESHRGDAFRYLLNKTNGRHRGVFIISNEFPLSELHTFQPELPPEV